MKKYETVIIINDSLEQAKKDETTNKIRNFITTNGELEKIDVMGSRKLAYEVRKQKTGYYVDIYFNAEPSVITELERIYRITDEILKYMTIRVDE